MAFFVFFFSFAVCALMQQDVGTLVFFLVHMRRSPQVGQATALTAIPGALDGLDEVEYEISPWARQHRAAPIAAQQLARTMLLLQDPAGAVRGVVTLGQLQEQGVDAGALQRLQAELLRWHEEVGGRAARLMGLLVGQALGGSESEEDD